eukprot:2182471-Pyramimonas_sp.AAC.1
MTSMSTTTTTTSSSPLCGAPPCGHMWRAPPRCSGHHGVTARARVRELWCLRIVNVGTFKTSVRDAKARAASWKQPALHPR